MNNKDNALTSIAQGTNPIWTASCFCKNCDNKPFVKLELVEFATKADELGFDLSDIKQLKKLNHLVLQANA